MKVVQVVGYHQNLQLDEAPEPTITSPLDVIVKIGAAGVCRTDLHILEGQWEEKSGVKLPYTIGHENAGWVHEVGDGVTGLKKGDKVRAVYCFASRADSSEGHPPSSCYLRSLPCLPLRR